MTELFACPCCGYLTLSQPAGGTYEICEVCFWEDDPVQLADPDYCGGANHPSLRQAQANFREFGACDRRDLPHVKNRALFRFAPDWQPLPPK